MLLPNFGGASAVFGWRCKGWLHHRELPKGLMPAAAALMGLSDCILSFSEGGHRNASRPHLQSEPRLPKPERTLLPPSDLGSGHSARHRVQRTNIEMSLAAHAAG